jgi:hypothetical protein
MSPGAVPDAPRGPRDLIWVLAATMGVCTILLAWSIGSAPVLGNESYPNLRSCALKSALAGAPGLFGGESFHYI